MSRLIQHSRPWILPEDEEAVYSLIKQKNIAHGEKADAFKKQMEKHTGSLMGMLCANGTQAVRICLQACGAGKDDEVILPSYLCASVYAAVKELGAVPVICDIGKDWNMTLENIEGLLTARTKAVILVRLFGIVLEESIVRRLTVPVIEDCCQCIMPESYYRNSFHPDFRIFSFHATKCLSTGDGGFIACYNENYYESLLRQEIYSAFTDIQAVLGLNGLDRYQAALNHRKRIAELYFNNLPDSMTNKLKSIKGISMYYRFPLEVAPYDFERTRSWFEERNIAVRRGVDRLIHRIDKRCDDGFQNTVTCFHTTLSIPIYPDLTEKEIFYIIEQILEWGKQSGNY